MMDDRVKAIMALPYLRTVQPDENAWFAQVLEFSGCYAVGDTAEAAISSLNDVMESWLLSVFAQGQDVPEPFETESGTVARSLRRAMGRPDFSRRSALTPVHAPIG